MKKLTRVRWEFDAVSPDPVEAAKEARLAQTRPDTIAKVFDVECPGGAVQVDLHLGTTKRIHRKWRRIDEASVRHYYTRQCPCVTQDTLYFSPDFFENNTPGCPECGTYMIYDHTEVRS